MLRTDLEKLEWKLSGRGRNWCYLAAHVPFVRYATLTQFWLMPSIATVLRVSMSAESLPTNDIQHHLSLGLAYQHISSHPHWEHPKRIAVIARKSVLMLANPQWWSVNLSTAPLKYKVHFKNKIGSQTRWWNSLKVKILMSQWNCFIMCYLAGNSFRFLVNNLVCSFAGFPFLAATFAPASWGHLSIGWKHKTKQLPIWDLS